MDVITTFPVNLVVYRFYCMALFHSQTRRHIIHFVSSIGYNIIGINSQRSYQGYWANGRDTSVSVGVWGHLQPDPDAGACTYVKATESGNLWYTTGCDRVMPFVCEMDPCPVGKFEPSQAL